MATKKMGGKTVSTGTKVGVGIGLTAAAVAAAGAYFLLGSKNAATNRKKMRGWTLKAKGEVLEALEKAQEISGAEYNALVETATKAYGTVERATKGEMKDFHTEMLEHWSKLQKNKAVKKIAGAVSKTATKKVPAKKVAKKASAKKTAK